MPRKTTSRRRYSRKRKTYKRKSYRRRRSNLQRSGPGNIMAIAPVSNLGFPKNKIVRMRFAEGQLLTVNAGATYGEAHYHASSIYDPLTAAGGRQPLGYDQWAAFYNHYVVLGSTITVTASHIVGLPVRAIVFGCYLDDDTAAAADWTPIVESGRCAWTVLNPGDSIGSQHNQKSLKCYYSAKKFFNVADVKDNLDRIGAPFGANPADGAFFKIFLASTDKGTLNQNTSFDLTVTIDYTVMLSEPKDLPYSS